MLSEELKRPVRWRDILIGVVVGLVVSAYVIGHTSNPNQFIFPFILSYCIGVIAHEMGHALVAAGAGAKVNYVRLGTRLTNRPPWKFRFLNLDWFIYGLPFSGSVQSDFYSIAHYRVKRCAVIAGGPLANLVLLAAGLIIINNPQISPSWQSPLTGWMLANAYLAAISLLPRMIRSYGMLTPNDGLNIWRTWRSSDSEVETIIRNAVTRRDYHVGAALAENMSVEELLAKANADKPDLAILWLLSEKLRLAGDARYPKYVLKLIDRPEVAKSALVELIDIYLTWQLERGPSEDPEADDSLSQRLLTLEDNLSTRGTRGSVLVNIGRVDEGKALLLDVLVKTQSNIDKGYSNVFLALADKQAGDAERARAYALAAAKAYPKCPALKRVADLLEPASARTGA